VSLREQDFFFKPHAKAWGDRVGTARLREMGDSLRCFKKPVESAGQGMEGRCGGLRRGSSLKGSHMRIDIEKERCNNPLGLCE